MRVITGFARGRKLKALDGESVRPTGDRVKEAVFSIIQFELEGRSFLDLFAGSGQMGIEALSRGAASCVFVEKDKDAYSVIKDNLAHTKLEESAKVLNTDA
ncbi:MAG TPA: 16S rRNA (guanine(966)-N(2))-methyltransferase RsmD, partial [Oscillospiraceae bacterium]|nr:16S rRNA (guanine(966)-N(2))-methyltransferase RsmD [Oscillospiraceae bacterium]